MTTININKKRFFDDFYSLGQIGWVEGEGLQRLSYSQSYIEAREWLRTKMEKYGLSTRIDRVGNLFGRIEGKTASTILLGSHLDSVNNGGIYDGPLGIISALEALASIKENGIITNKSFEVVAFVAEEGEPLGGTFGSRTFAGLIPEGYKEETLAALDITALDIKSSKGDIGKYIAFLELHIEQGPFLERKGLDIGIPSGIVGISRSEIIIRGAANHAGTTPMSERKDAMRVAADIIHEWFKWMDKQDNIVCNVGKLSVKPGHVSVVPEEVTFLLELRSLDDNLVKYANKVFKKTCKLYQNKPCSIEIKSLGSKPAVLLDQSLIELIKDTAEKMELKTIVMPSGASHDASPMAKVMPTAMIFVPSHEGISHAKGEYTPDKNVICGGALLLKSLIEMDRVL